MTQATKLQPSEALLTKSSSPSDDAHPQFTGTTRRRFNPLTMAAIMIIPLIIVVALGLALLESNRGQLNAGKAPDFVVKTYDGAAFQFSAQRGKIVIVNFWGSWCGPCQAEAPDLNAIWDEYRDRGVVMIGVGYLDTPDNARAFLERNGVTYPTGHDDGSEITRQYGTRQVPETFIIDRDGTIAAMIPGKIDVVQLRAVLDKLLLQES